MADNARIPKVVPNGTGAVHAACGTLVTDAEMANSELPTPDSQVTDLADQGLRPGGHGGQRVLRRRARPTRRLLATAERNAIKAEALYDEVARIRIHRRSVAATTTTTTTRPIGIFG